MTVLAIAPAQAAKERPILFSGPMVQALLAGNKTQTRRNVGLEDVNAYEGSLEGLHPIIGGSTLGYQGLAKSDYYIKNKKGYAAAPGLYHEFHGVRVNEFGGQTLNIIPVRCPYGAVGDKLWVRESWQAFMNAAWESDRIDDEAPGFWHEFPHPKPVGGHVLYAATDPAMTMCAGWKWLPSIHMPRWASRLTLEITEVRVQRLHDISEADAWAEGITQGEYQVALGSAVGACSILWERINGVGSWDANPWVWAVSVKKVAQ